MKHLIFTIIAALSLCRFLAAATTTQPTIYIRDCSTQADTAATLANGGNLYLSSLPAKFTLDYDFGLPKGHTAQVTFTVDGSETHGYWTPPYCPVGHNEPLVLKPGPHTIAVVLNGVSIPSTTFNLANAPPATQPSPPSTATLGTNLIGADYPSGDFLLHPQLAAAGKSLGLVVFRDWEEETQLAKVGDAYWSNHRKIQAAGFKTALQIQMPNKGMWADNGAAMAQRVVAGHATDFVLLGNEFNTVRNLADPGTYFLGGDAAATKYCATVGPIFTAAGITPVAPSRINDFAGIVSRFDSGAYAGLKSVDLHLYSNDENWLAAQFKQFDAFCAANELQGWVSEWNLRMRKGETLAQWGVRMQVVLKAIQGTSLIVCHFSAIPTGHPPDDVTALLDARYQPLSLSIFGAVWNPAMASK